jgi:hypothetical protein
MGYPVTLHLLAHLVVFFRFRFCPHPSSAIDFCAPLPPVGPACAVPHPCLFVQFPSCVQSGDLSVHMAPFPASALAP